MDICVRFCFEKLTFSLFSRARTARENQFASHFTDSESFDIELLLGVAANNWPFVAKPASLRLRFGKGITQELTSCSECSTNFISIVDGCCLSTLCNQSLSFGSLSSLRSTV